MMPNWLASASKDPSSKGRSRALACCHRIDSEAGRTRSARASMAGLRSVAVIVAVGRMRCSARVTTPVPAAVSRMLPGSEAATSAARSSAKSRNIMGTRTVS
jgi:hypothetical protein